MSLSLLGWESRENLHAAAHDLDAAAQLLEEAGWIQGEYFDKEEGCFCAAGAVFDVNGISWSNASSYRKISNQPGAQRAVIAISTYQRINDQSMLAYNDTPGRKASEVIASLRETAHYIRMRVAREPDND